MDAHYTFTGPSFNIQLCPTDQVAVLNWSPRILIFSLPENDGVSGSSSSSNEEIVSILRQGIQETVNQFPELAGSLVQPPYPRHGEKQQGLRYIDQGEAHLKVRDLTAKYDLEEWREGGFSQHKLLPDELCPTPGWDHPAARPLELFSVQANFVKSGLLLVVSVFHTICDGTAQFHVTEMLANQCRAIGQRKASGSPSSASPSSSSPSSSSSLSAKLNLSFSPQQFDRSRLWQGAAKSDVSALSTYSVLPEPLTSLPAWAIPDGKPLQSDTFVLRKAALAELKALATSQKPPSSSSSTGTVEPYISTHDAVCALIWRTIMAARLKTGAIEATETSTFGTVVDGRSKLSPPLPIDFLGNVAIGFMVGESVQKLVDPSNLGSAAFSIRSGVKSVDDGYIKNLITLLQEVPDTSQMWLDCLENIKTTGLFLTSWQKFDYAALKWPGQFGECEAFRFPNGGYLDGVVVMFPPSRYGDWEFILTLEETAMKAFREDEILNRFASVE